MRTGTFAERTDERADGGASADNSGCTRQSGHDSRASASASSIHARSATAAPALAAPAIMACASCRYVARRARSTVDSAATRRWSHTMAQRCAWLSAAPPITPSTAVTPAVRSARCLRPHLRTARTSARNVAAPSAGVTPSGSIRRAPTVRAGRSPALRARSASARTEIHQRVPFSTHASNRAPCDVWTSTTAPRTSCASAMRADRGDEALSPVPAVSWSAQCSNCCSHRVA